MTKNNSLFFRFLLFIAGAGVILLAFFLTKGGEELTGIDTFMWISIGVMYLIFFLPFFFSVINISNFSGKIPAISMVWLGISLYIAASIVNIVILKNYVIVLNAAIIIQAILLFIFFVNIYFAYFATSHVSSVAAQEAVKQQYLNQIKPKAQSLLISVNKLPSQYKNAQSILIKTLEDIRFIYPVDKGAGDDLETQIMQSLNIISEMCGNISAGSSVMLDEPAEKLQMLVKERKLLRN